MSLGVIRDTFVAANAVRRPCACGTDIVCIDDEDGIRIGLRAHQATPEHEAWRNAHPEFDHPWHEVRDERARVGRRFG